MKWFRRFLEKQYFRGLQRIFKDMSDAELWKFARGGAVFADILFTVGLFISTSWFFTKVLYGRVGFEVTVLYLLVALLFAVWVR